MTYIISQTNSTTKTEFGKPVRKAAPSTHHICVGDQNVQSRQRGSVTEVLTDGGGVLLPRKGEHNGLERLAWAALQRQLQQGRAGHRWGGMGYTGEAWATRQRHGLQGRGALPLCGIGYKADARDTKERHGL